LAKDKWRFRRPLFLKLSISYVLFLAVPFLIGSLIYSRAVQTVKDDAVHHNLLLLEQTKEIMDARLREIEAIGRQILLDPRMNSLLNAGRIGEGSPDNYLVWETINYNPKFNVVNTFIHNYFVLFRHNPIVLSSNTAYPDRVKFMQSLFGERGTEKTRQFEQMLWERFHHSEFLPGGQVMLDRKPHEVIFYLQSFPVDSVGNPLGVVLILVDRNKIEDLLSRLDVGDNGFVFVSDASGRIITSLKASRADANPEMQAAASVNNGFFRTDDGKVLYVSRTVSEFNEWNYVSAVPADLVLSKVQYIKNFTIIAALLTIAAGIASALFLGYRDTRPVKQLLQQLRDWLGGEEDHYTNEYDCLNVSVTRLIENHHVLHERIQKQLPLLRQAFFRKLLWGEFVDEQEMETFQRRVGLDLSAGSFCVLLVRVDEIAGNSRETNKALHEPARMFHIIVKNEIARMLRNFTCYDYDMDENKFALIVGWHKESPLDANESNLPKMIHDQLSQTSELQSRVRVSIAAGGIYTEIRNLYISFLEAKQTLEYVYGQERGWTFASYADIPQASDRYYYPIDLEFRLINGIKSGNRTDVEQVLSLLYMENFEKRNLTVPVAEQLLYLMIGSVFRGLEPVNEASAGELLIGEVRRKESLEELFQRIRKAFLDSCDAIRSKNEKNKTDLRKRIEAFLQQNYTRADLTLAMAADEFGLSEAYLYQLIKEQLGITFSDYVEQLRIRRACELLSNQGLPVKEVAFMTGYGSDRTFRRAFKRVMGVPPTAYPKIVSEPVAE
jgi:AraC-like DNA-binding protein